MIIVWHLLADPQARYRDLGPDFHASRINRDKKIRTHLQGLKALGVTVAITDHGQAAQPRRPDRPRNGLTRPGTSSRPGSSPACPAQVRCRAPAGQDLLGQSAAAT